MRKVSFSVTENGTIEPSRLEIGHAGEHNATTLFVELPQVLCNETEYFRLAIGSYQTEQLYANDNTISYTLPQCVLISGTQFLQLEGYKHSDKGELLLIFKSDIALVEVLPSIDPYNETTDEVRCDVDGALGKLHYYVTKSDQLAEDLKASVNECAEILEETKSTVEGKADKSELPKNVSELNNDKGYLVENDIKDKADRADTLSGYGITDAYTKHETDLALSEKADKNKILDYITYEITDNKVIITSCSTEISGAHVIPDTIEGYPVTKIGVEAFYNCTKLQGISIPDSVTVIGDHAFWMCISLRSVNIGNRFIEMEACAFASCRLLESIEIPDNAECMGGTFEMCYSLKKATIPKSATRVIGGLFVGCTGLISVTIPESVVEIGEWAFDACDALTDIYYDGTKEQWDKIVIGEYNEPLANANIHYKYSEVPTPTQDADAANKEYVDALKTKKVLIQSGDVITLADNTTYYAEAEINNLTILYPETDFICSLDFTLAADGNITITIPTSKYIGGAPTFANGETWEINIKNGVVVGGLLE